MIKILVIEDEFLVRLSLVDLLCAEGYFVIQADNGEEGIQLAWEHLPDLVLCDVMMPRLDGFGVLSRLSKDPATALIPFIFLTARSDMDDLRRGMGLGADDYLVKPFKISDLLNAVETRLEKKAALERQAQRKLAELSQARLILPSHLITHISLILGFSEIMANPREAGRLEQSQIRGMAIEINQAASRLLRSVQNTILLLQLEQIQCDPQRMQQMLDSSVNSAGLVIAEMAALKAEQDHRSPDLTLKMADCVLNMSEIYLQKIVEELLDNAFLNSPSGFPVEVSSELLPEKHLYRLRIKDYGRGITPEKLAWLNNLSFQAAQDDKRDEQGLGILLVKYLVEIHGGSFRLQSELKAWTVADVLLPVKADRP